MLEEHSKNIRRERKKMQWGTYVSEGCLQFFHGWNTDKKKRQRLTTTTEKKNVEEVRRDRTWSWKIKIPPAVSNPTPESSREGHRSYHTRPDISCEGWLTAQELGFPSQARAACPATPQGWGGGCQSSRATHCSQDPKACAHGG